MAGFNDKDYYAVLEVSEEASAEEIRKAFQKKAVKLHPDVNKEPDAEERFKEVSEAYAVLSDPDKRARYDAMRKNPYAAAAGGAPAGYGRYNPSTSDPFAGFGFPFGGAWTGARTSTTRSRSYNPKAGADFVYTLTLDEHDAAQGVRRGITYQHYAPCPDCEGRGSKTSEHPQTCSMCSGSGHITVDIGTFMGIGVINVVCPECEGSGRVVAEPCSSCGGSGRVISASEMVVEVPAGSHDGDVVRMEGKGNAGTNGSEAGDFVCRIAVPTEQLDTRQAGGFRAIGFALPFLGLALLNGWGYVFPALFIALGVFLVATSNLRGRGRYWWRNAGLAVLSGLSGSLPFVVMFAVMSMCTAAWHFPYVH